MMRFALLFLMGFYGAVALAGEDHSQYEEGRQITIGILTVCPVCERGNNFFRNSSDPLGFQFYGITDRKLIARIMDSIINTRAELEGDSSKVGIVAQFYFEEKPDPQGPFFFMKKPDILLEIQEKQ